MLSDEGIYVTEDGVIVIGSDVEFVENSGGGVFQFFSYILNWGINFFDFFFRG